MSRKAFLVTFLLVALLLAGVGSFYASSHPDGLEYVAEKTGFGHQAGDSSASDSPFADYSTKGIDDARVSGGVAGVTGALIVLVLAGGLAWTVRRRGSSAGQQDAAAQGHPEQPDPEQPDAARDSTPRASADTSSEA